LAVSGADGRRKKKVEGKEWNGQREREHESHHVGTAGLMAEQPRNNDYLFSPASPAGFHSGPAQ
jgi:hypothetical protein